MRHRKHAAFIPAVLACVACAAHAGGLDEVHWSGQFDVVAASRGPAIALNAFNRGDGPFDTYRLRLFAEAPVADGVGVFAQLMYQEDVGASLYGAYAMVTPFPASDLHVIGGKIPWRIGTYAERTYSNRNPLIGTPLMYQYHTSLRADRLPPSADALAGAAGSGQFGPVYDASGRGWRGMPIVYDRCWDAGIMVTGSARPIEFSAGLVNGAPSNPNAGNDRNSGKSWLGRIGLQPWPGVRVGASGSWGPYLPDAFAAGMPPGKTVNGYAQKLLMADGEWLVSHLEIRGEGIWNVWETPTAGDAEVRGGYVEARIALPHGAFAAGRWDVLRFGDVTDSTGAARAWDLDLSRVEAGLGYRVQRGVIVKAIYQQTRFLRGSDIRESLYAAQAALSF
jgi:hypothetical protein